MMSSSAGPKPFPGHSIPPNTDPTGFDAVESLFRQSDGAVRRASGVRHFQPALRPPEDTDGYGWLYRPVEAAGPTATPDATVTTATSGVAVLAPASAPDPSWAVAATPRRWPALLLVTPAILAAALLALLVLGAF